MSNRAAPAGRPVPAGREPELARITSFLADMTPGARALIVEGEPGIGKTTVWQVALEQARAGGAAVLVAQPAEEELPAAALGLHDLFDGRDVDAAVLADDTDVFDRGRAVLGALRTLAGAAPVVVAVDDLHWLDALSMRTLRYALRRIADEPVRILATRRSGVAGGDLVDPDATDVIVLGALSLDDLRQAVAPVAATISRPAMAAIHELSAGNPMYALELARAPAGGTAAPPGGLHRALSARLAAAPAAVVGAVRTAAALGPASPEALAAAADGQPEVLAAAVDLGLLTLDESMAVRCAHPLLASVALADMAANERRRLHARLAAGTSDADARAHHLALATVERDAAAAALLEEAADRAGRRGAPRPAAELAAHSVRLTPLDDRTALARRAVAEILHRAAAGETARAIAMVDAIVQSLPPGRERFAAMSLLVGLDFGRGEEVLAKAHEEAAADELTRGRILDLLAYTAYMYRGELDRARSLADQARTIAVQVGDPELEMLSSATLATVALLTGDPQPELLDRALELGRGIGTFRLGRWPEVERARQCVWDGELAAARAAFEKLQAMTARSGLEFQRPYRLVDLAAVELAAGNLTVAARLAGDGIESALDAGNGPIIAWLHYPEGLAAAHLGDHDRAARAVTEMRAWGTARGERPRLLMAHHVAGVDALAAGDPATALDELLDGLALADRAGQAHPGVIALLPDALEASAALGRGTLAAELAATLDRQARALGRPWVDAAARRGRGLAALAGGAPADGVEHLAAAADAFGGLGYRLDAARAVRWHGVALHRAGRRRAGDDVLADATERFRLLGARAWVALTAGAGPRTFSDLEQRIVDLVAAGRRNREIADDLHVSVATVEATLSRIYRAIGVRSRSELARWALDPPSPERDASASAVR